jgi:hypothetical protein
MANLKVALHNFAFAPKNGTINSAKAMQSATLCMLCTLCLLRSLHQVATLAAIRTTQQRKVTDFFISHLHKMLAGRLPWESDDEVLLLYAVGNKCERKWVHKVNMKRRELNEFYHLMKQLRQDEIKFKEYFRMSSNHSRSRFRASSFIKLNKNQLDAPLF